MIKLSSDILLKEGRMLPRGTVEAVGLSTETEYVSKS